MADLLPDEDRAVQFFYYGDGLPVGFCARNAQTGMMIDALVIPLTILKPDAAKDKATQDKATEGKPQEAEEPKPNRRRRKKDEPEPAPEANGQAQPSQATPAAEGQAGQDATPDDRKTPCPMTPRSRALSKDWSRGSATWTASTPS